MTVKRRSAAMVALVALAGPPSVLHAEAPKSGAPSQEATATPAVSPERPSARGSHPAPHLQYRWPSPPRPVYGWPPAPYGAPPLPPRPRAAPVPPASDLIDELADSAQFSTLVQALEVVDLDELLRGDGPFTLLAPTNAAFDALPEGVTEQLLADGERLRRVLEHHIVEGRLSAADLLVAGELQALTGHTIGIDALSVRRADLEASNGVIHVLDELLAPPMF